MLSLHRMIVPAALAAMIAAPAHGQGPRGVLWDSYARAAEVLRQGAEAHGGAQAIRGLSAAAFRWEGEDYAPTQGRVPAATWDTAGNGRGVTSDVRVDFARGRYAWDREFRFGGGYLNAIRVLGNGRELLSYNHQPGRGMGGTTYQRDTTGTPQRRTLSSLAGSMPVLLIRQALERSNTLRYLGRSGDGAHVVTYTTSEGDPVTLHFDTATHLLTRRDDLGAGSLGDEVDAVHFAGYEQVGGFSVPRRLELRWNGLLAGRQRLVSFAPAAELPDTLFRVPAGYTTPSAGGPPAMTRVAEGVYYVERIGGGYRSLVVDTEEGVVVVDAPLNPDASGAAIALIERTLPGRPIRYLVVTHHHGDHIGGIPAYAARGATILAAPGSEAYLRRMLTVTRTLGRIGAAPAAASPLTIETLAGRRTIGRGERAVEVLDVGPTSHAAAMLAVYVPSQKLLFQGDLLRINEHGGPVAAPEAARDLAALIRRFRLDVRTIGSVHGLNGTMDDVR